VTLFFFSQSVHACGYRSHQWVDESVPVTDNFIDGHRAPEDRTCGHERGEMRSNYASVRLVLITNDLCRQLLLLLLQFDDEDVLTADS
jgi:hypothetical protein